MASAQKAYQKGIKDNGPGKREKACRRRVAKEGRVRVDAPSTFTTRALA